MCGLQSKSTLVPCICVCQQHQKYVNFILTFNLNLNCNLKFTWWTAEALQGPLLFLQDQSLQSLLDYLQLGKYSKASNLYAQTTSHGYWSLLRLTMKISYSFHSYLLFIFFLWIFTGYHRNNTPFVYTDLDLSTLNLLQTVVLLICDCLELQSQSQFQITTLTLPPPTPHHNTILLGQIRVKFLFLFTIFA